MRLLRFLSLLLASCTFTIIKAETARSYRYDRDTGTQCQAKAEKEYCIKDPQAFFDCPITCSKHMRPSSPHKGAHESDADPPIYEFVLPTADGSKVDFDTYAGEILLIVLIPSYPGLAQFNYELVHHVVANMYKYLVEAVIVPMEGQDGILIEELPGKIKLLKGPANDTNNRLVAYLKGKIQEGMFDATKVNAFIINPNGNHIEMHISPDLNMYKTYIDYQLQDLQEEL